MHTKSSQSPLAKTHHHHHTHPTELAVTDLHRIAIVPVLAALVAIAVLLNNYFTPIVGFCFGIEGYFLMHRMLHVKTGQRMFKKLVRYHMYHHCKYPQTCFGISVPWWDDVFKTVPSTPKLTQRIIDFYFNDAAKSTFHEIPPPPAQ
jgi:sterol desaturase/sphingolipid hydroxylase (fatty acid hydroxylase superfamily)